MCVTCVCCYCSCMIAHTCIYMFIETQTYNVHIHVHVYIRESIDSLCRDDVDMPRLPYIRKDCNHPNTGFVSLFR